MLAQSPLTIVDRHLVIESEPESLRHADGRPDFEPTRVVPPGGQLVESEQDVALASHKGNGYVGGRRWRRRLPGRRFWQGEEMRCELGVMFGSGGGGVRMQVAQWRAEACGESEDASEQLFGSTLVVDLGRQAGRVDEREGVVADGVQTSVGCEKHERRSPRLTGG